MRVALVCIAKNEDKYIKEWVEYHLKLGFDDVFVYQNDWRLLENINNLHKLELDGKKQQKKAYNLFIEHYKSSYDWAAFFDVDEFLVLKKHKNIKDFISDYSEYPSIGVNWVFFGNNGHTKVDGDYSVVKRFTKRQSTVDTHIKSIVKLNKGVLFNEVHHPNTFWVNTNQEKHKSSFTKVGNDEVAQLNHYFCKTEEEFIEKCDRGRADNGKLRDYSEYHSHNYNEIEDLNAYNFFYK